MMKSKTAASVDIVVRPPPSELQPAAEFAQRDLLALEHLPLVKTIAGHLRANLPMHVDLDDLVHAGMIGLMDAAGKYDAGMQVSFPSYAKHRIRGAILDSLRQLDWASRDMRRRQKQVESTTADLSLILQRAPTEAEAAASLGIEVKRWRIKLRDLPTGGPVSASTHANEDDELPQPDFPAKSNTHPDVICARKQLGRVLGDAMKTLPARYRKVVLLYHSDELTMKEVGEVLGINESRVSQIHKLALQKMAVNLRGNGIDSIQAF